MRCPAEVDHADAGGRGAVKGPSDSPAVPGLPAGVVTALLALLASGLVSVSGVAVAVTVTVAVTLAGGGLGADSGVPASPHAAKASSDSAMSTAWRVRRRSG